MSIQHIGKRLKSNKDRTMFWRFPGSDDIKTLPIGKPSPVITSYLANGYYQLKGTPDKNLYLKKGSDLIVVDKNAIDDSGFFSGAYAGVSDWLNNTTTEAQKQAGFLSDGFSKSVSGVGTGFLNFNKSLTPIIWGIVALFALFIISKLTK